MGKAVDIAAAHDLAIGYAIVVIMIAVSLSSKQTHDRIVLDCSTNLVNLRVR
jgi:hypothetical protein